ncbi:MAG: hypothetical protein HYZ26_02410 [Chloroflexi bacterium]|nr:hypothetical protein [Chloroflexota bacterium]
MRQLFTLWLAAVLLAACVARTSQPEPPTPTPYSGEVSWETALSLLPTGQVTQVVQLHNLTVTLYLENGSILETVEPEIDAIFFAIEQCGAPCADIAIATE